MVSKALVQIMRKTQRPQKKNIEGFELTTDGRIEIHV